jgi:hypothetical protein
MRTIFSILLLIGCSGGGPVAETRMELSTAGLGGSSVGSVMVLVLSGAHATCDAALAPPSPLDDADLQVVQHALFAVDGTAKHLSIPADEELVFYAEAFASSDGSGTRIGRGCAEAKLSAGESAGVPITLTATHDGGS